MFAFLFFPFAKVWAFAALRWLIYWVERVNALWEVPDELNLNRDGKSLEYKKKIKRAFNYQISKFLLLITLLFR